MRSRSILVLPARPRIWSLRDAPPPVQHRAVDTRDPAAPTPSTPPPWHAQLALRFARVDGVTRLATRHHRGPLRVQRLLRPEANGCDALLLHPPGGIAGGDVLDIDIVLDPSAAVLLSTPGAGKWYRCDTQAATQQVRLRVADDAALEWLPQEAILFRGADAIQTLQIDLAARAACIGWDIVQFGRVAAGEAWDRGRLRQRLELRRDGITCWRERADLHAASPLMQARAALAGRRVCGTLWAASPRLSAQPDTALDAVRTALSAHATTAGLISPREPAQSSCCAAATWLAAPADLLLVRALADDGETVRAVLEAAWHALRPPVLDRAPRLPRIWAT